MINKTTGICIGCEKMTDAVFAIPEDFSVRHGNQKERIKPVKTILVSCCVNCAAIHNRMNNAISKAKFEVRISGEK